MKIIYKDGHVDECPQDQELHVTAPAADAAAPAEEDPFDSIFKIFNSK